jgi:hypothetical protein
MISCVLENPFPPNISVLASPALSLNSRHPSPPIPQFAKSLFANQREDLVQPDLTRSSNSSGINAGDGLLVRQLMATKSLPPTTSPPMLPSSFTRLKQETAALADSIGDVLRRRASPIPPAPLPSSSLKPPVKQSIDALDQEQLVLYATGVIPRTRKQTTTIVLDVQDTNPLIPPKDLQRHQRWRQVYADQLYRWGMLTHHAQLEKFIIRRDSLYGHSGLEFGPRCHQCRSDLHTRMCPQCLKYAIRCAICQLPPRGLGTFCYLCGHGGHTIHLREWFLSEQECPQGCGCTCLASGGMTTFI